MPGGLCTDLYELKMAASYLRRGMEGQATFSLFARRLPRDRAFLVAAGLEDALDFLERFGFEADDLAYLREIGFPERDLSAFGELRFTGEVWAMPEGRIALAHEPLLEVTAPIAEAQLVETALLNLVTSQTTIASKAARCRIAARDRGLVDFAYRRTQGMEAARAMARVCGIVGFASTSNVAAAREFSIMPSGTMAHSYIEAFEHEEEAFAAFADDFPGQVTFLIDTYDAIEGLRRAIDLLNHRRLPGPVGIRLDSGDLGQLSRRARQMLDEAGLTGVRIFASGGLDEFSVDELVGSGAPIDAFGVGTRVGVSADSPYTDTAYKLVDFEGRPVMKLSPGKASLPAAKQVFRGQDMEHDVIALRGERGEGEPLLQQVMKSGRRVAPRATITASRARFEADLAKLPEAALKIRSPRAPMATVSEELNRLAKVTSARLREQARQPF